MAYTYDLTTEIGQVRLLIGDRDITPTTDAQFSDEELQIFLNIGRSILMAAAKALEAWAGNLKTSMTSETIGEYTYKQGTVKNLLDLAGKYAKQDRESPYMTWAEMDLASIGDTEIA